MTTITGETVQIIRTIVTQELSTGSPDCGCYFDESFPYTCPLHQILGLLANTVDLVEVPF